MSFSTMFPKNAADIPRQKIAILKAHSTEVFSCPISVAIVSLTRDQQYTVPMLQCRSNAGIAALIYLLLNFPMNLTSLLLLDFIHFLHYTIDIFILQTFLIIFLFFSNYFFPFALLFFVLVFIGCMYNP